MMSFQRLIVSVDEGVGWLTLNRPDSGNAFDNTMLDELEIAWTQLDADPEVRAIVVTGAGRQFCTGMDVVQVSRDRDAMRRHSRRTRDAQLRISSWHCGVWKPVIAAVNGVVAGGGLHLVVDADIVIASSAASFVDPHVSVGQAVAYEAITMLRKSPMEATTRMALVGRAERISAQRAFDLGVVGEVVHPDDLCHAAHRTALAVAANPPSAVRASKRALWRALEVGTTQALTEAADTIRARVESADRHHSVTTRIRERAGIATVPRTPVSQPSPPERTLSMDSDAPYERLIVERRGPVGWIINNRPERLNAYDATMRAEFPRAWRELDDDPDVRVIVHTGNGRAFMAGADVDELDGESVQEFADTMANLDLRLTAWHMRVGKPVIVAVNGVCAGGGLHWVADADIVMAARTASFVDPHVSIGQVSALETIALMRKVPAEAVLRMALVGSGERLSAERAHQIGMVGQLVDTPEELREAAQELGEKIARNSPSAMRATKRALWGALEEGLTDACRTGARHLTSMWGHPDQDEGPKAFAEKREPVWLPAERES